MELCMQDWIWVQQNFRIQLCSAKWFQYPEKLFTPEPSTTYEERWLYQVTHNSHLWQNGYSWFQFQKWCSFDFRTKRQFIKSEYTKNHYNALHVWTGIFQLELINMIFATKPKPFTLFQSSTSFDGLIEGYRKNRVRKDLSVSIRAN